MTTYYLNDTPIVEGSEITLNGFTYPYSWLEGTSPAVRASLGIEADGDINYDTKYYWAVGEPKLLDDREEQDAEGNPVYVKILGDINGESAMVDSDELLVTKGLRTICTAEVKSTTNDLLSSSDYYIIRNEVENLQIPADVVTYRAAVIAESDRVTTAIAEVASVEELVEVMSSIAWPKAN